MSFFLELKEEIFDSVDKNYLKMNFHLSNSICLGLIFVETIMFNGIFAGWNILCKMFKKDDMFCTELPSTDLQTKPEVDCSEQGKCFLLKKLTFIMIVKS